MAEQVIIVEADGAIHIPLAVWQQAGLGPGAQVRIEPAPDRLVISPGQSVVDRLMGKIHLTPQLAAEIIQAPELNIEVS